MNTAARGFSAWSIEPMVNWRLAYTWRHVVVAGLMLSVVLSAFCYCLYERS